MACEGVFPSVEIKTIPVRGLKPFYPPLGYIFTALVEIKTIPVRGLKRESD
jgi:hypothetical protein